MWVSLISKSRVCGVIFILIGWSMVNNSITQNSGIELWIGCDSNGAICVCTPTTIIVKFHLINATNDTCWVTTQCDKWPSCFNQEINSSDLSVCFLRCHVVHSISSNALPKLVNCLWKSLSSTSHFVFDNSLLCWVELAFNCAAKCSFTMVWMWKSKIKPFTEMIHAVKVSFRIAVGSWVLISCYIADLSKCSTFNNIYSSHNY